MVGVDWIEAEGECIIVTLDGRSHLGPYHPESVQAHVASLVRSQRVWVGCGSVEIRGSQGSKFREQGACQTGIASESGAGMWTCWLLGS